MVQDHGTGSWWWRNIIAREHHCPIVDHHPGPRGGEGEGGSRRAGEQLHPAPTWEHGGWRMEDHGMEDDCVSTRWPITMACRDGILLSHYWNGILLQYYCEGISMLGQTVPPCDSMFHGPCSMVHVPWSMFHGRPLNPYLFLLLPLLLLRLLLPLLLLRLLLPLLPPPQPGTLTRGTLTRTCNPNPDARVRRLAWRGWAGMGRGED
jgi:hypothetical protein